MGENSLLTDTAEARRLQDRLRVLSETTRAFAEATPNYQRLLDSVARRLADIIGDTCSVRLLSPDEKSLVTVSLHVPTLEASEQTRRLIETLPVVIADQPAVLRILESGEPLMIRKVEPGQLGRGLPRSYEEIDRVRSLLMLPLRLNGKSIGILTLSRVHDGSPPFDDQDRDFAQMLADHASLAIGNARSYAEIAAARDAAEKARAELRGARSRFSHLEESGLLGIIVSDMRLGILEINDRLLEMVGYSRAEVMSKTFEWQSLTPPEWRAIDATAIRELDTVGVAGLREKQYVRKDGERIWVMAGSSKIETTGEIISFVLDITEKKKAVLESERLRQEHAADAKFRALVEAAPDALVIVGDGRVVIVNQQAETLFGYTREELIGKSIQELVPDGSLIDRDALRAQLFPGGASPQPRRLELIGRRKDGSEFPAEIALGPIETEAGRLVSSAIRDVTDRKRQEKQRFRLAAIVESSHDMIIACDVDSLITSWNAAAERVLGYRVAEVLGKSIAILLPEDRKWREKMLLERVRNGVVEQIDTFFRTKSGERLSVSVTNSPLHDPTGKLEGASCVARDVTERRRAEEALAQSKESAEAANRELESFSYSVAHDLRAPLRGMSGFAQLLLSEYGNKLDADGKDWLQEILSNAKRMGELIDALLSLSRLARSALQRETVDLSATARAVAAKLATADPGRQVAVVVQERLTVDADPILARALMDNLLGNAWKFSSKSGSPRIEVGTLEKNGAHAFFVRDNGAGFDMAYAHKLFAPFQRLHAMTEYPGTGIGLANVQRIVHRHGGKIWAEGEVNRGATFYFTLPNRSSGAISP